MAEARGHPARRFPGREPDFLCFHLHTEQQHQYRDCQRDDDKEVEKPVSDQSLEFVPHTFPIYRADPTAVNDSSGQDHALLLHGPGAYDPIRYVPACVKKGYPRDTDHLLGRQLPEPLDEEVPEILGDPLHRECGAVVLARLGRALDAHEARWPEAVAAIRLLALTLPTPTWSRRRNRSAGSLQSRC